MKPMQATTPNTNPSTKLRTPGVISTTPAAKPAATPTARLGACARGASAAFFVLHAAAALSMCALAALTSCRPATRPAVAPTAAVGSAPTLVATTHHPPLLDDADPASL